MGEHSVDETGSGVYSRVLWTRRWTFVYYDSMDSLARWITFPRKILLHGSASEVMWHL